jgi:hypothetical protein
MPIIHGTIPEYEIHDPWKGYTHYEPSKPDPEHVERLKREGKTPPPPPPPPKKPEKSFSLSEGDKAFSS